MPLRRSSIQPGRPAPAPTEPQAEPSLFERLGGLRGLLATGARVGSGLVGSTVSMEPGIGTALGGAIGGGGEALAELIEGDTPNWKRMGVEAALTAVPLGKVFSGARTAAVLKSAALSGAGVAGRDWARGQEIDPAELGTQTAIGAGLGALLGGHAPEIGGPSVSRDDYMARTRPWVSQKPEGWVPPPSEAEIAKKTVADRTAKMPEAQRRGVLKQQDEFEKALGKKHERVRDTEANLSDEFQTAISKNEAAGRDAEIAARRVQLAKAGLERQTPTVSETVSAPSGPGGTVRATTKWASPAEDEEDLSVLAGDRPVAPPPAPVEPPGPPTDLSTLLTPKPVEDLITPLSDVATTTPPEPPSASRLAQLALDAAPQESSLAETYGDQLDVNAARGGFQPRYPEKPVPQPPVAPAAPVAQAPVPEAPTGPEHVPSMETTTPGVHEMTPDEVAAEMRVVEKAKSDPNFMETLRRAAMEEKGAVSPALLRTLGMGLGGAALGAATDPLGNRPASAIAGGVAGVGLAQAPQILESLGAHPSVTRNLEQDVATNGVKSTAAKIAETLPQIQRFNYLLSVRGLPANAWAGPYGSAVMGALEHGLSGDARGWEALKLLKNPMDFMRGAKSAFPEAWKRLDEGELGRAEGLGLETGQRVTTAQRTLAYPGAMMTSGDIAARDILARAGFSEEEARRITLTSEPEFQFPRALTNIGKGKSDYTKVLGNILFPFRRTPANIWEQGMERFPGLGPFLQAQRDIPDSAKRQLVQQLMSGGVAGVSALVGANLDPETAKIAKRWMTNFAGQYSLPASMGFAAGQAYQGGKSIIPAAIQSGIGDLPLPSTQPVTELGKFLSDPSMATVPSGWTPSLGSELKQIAYPLTSTKPRPLKRLRRRS